MENQHRQIKGYRELSQAEIDLMNRIKSAGAEMLALHTQVTQSLKTQGETLINAANEVRQHLHIDDEKPEMLALAAFTDSEPHRWAAIAKTDIQTGLMALIRAVAQPTV